MDLKMLRKHYAYNRRTGKWQPKISFSSKNEARKKLGHSKVIIYSDCFCGKVHVASRPLKERVKK